MNRRTVFVLGVFVVVFASLRVGSFTRKSATFDEPVHLAAGYAALAEGDYRVDPTHPPFIRMWSALPLLLLDSEPPDGSRIDASAPAAWLRQLTIFARDFLYKQNDGDRLLYAARSMMLIWGLVLGVMIFWWTRDLFGDGAATFALACYTISPNLTAHASLVTTDFGEACFFFGTVFFLWRATRAKQPAVDLAACALCFSLAIVTKYSGLVLVPIVATLLLVGIFSRSNMTWRSAARIGGLLAVSGFIVIWACYRFRYEPSATGGWVFHLEGTPMVQQHLPILSMPAAWIDAHRLLPNAFTEGFVASQSSARMLPSFLDGQYSAHGWWYYFPIAFVLKTPLAFLLLIAAGLLAYLRHRRRFGALTTACLLLPVVGFMAVAMMSHINIGVRHILPIYPFVLVAAAAGAREIALRAGRTGRIAVAAITVFWLAQFVRVYPDTLTFFNAAVGGPGAGARYLTDSNNDWGQHLKRLKRWMDRHDVRHVNLAYFGTADPAYYGIERTDLLGSPFAGVRVMAAPTLPGYVAISTTILNGVYLPPRWRYYYRGFHNLQPVADIGHTIRIYRIDKWPEPPSAPIATPADAAMIWNLCDDLIRQHAYRHAVLHYRQYLEYRPDDTAALNNLGLALRDSGDTAGAAAAFQRAMAVEAARRR